MILSIEIPDLSQIIFQSNFMNDFEYISADQAALPKGVNKILLHIMLFLGEHPACLMAEDQVWATFIQHSVLVHFYIASVLDHFYTIFSLVHFYNACKLNQANNSRDHEGQGWFLPA